MVTQELFFWTLVTGCLSAVATGLGALPVLWFRRGIESFRALASATAAGMMLSAAVFSIAEKSFSVDHSSTFLGLLIGALLLYGLDQYHHQHEEAEGEPNSGINANLLFLAMLIHSIPEGVAIGVSFATQDLAFGLTMACAIAIHNIPEGVAISLPLAAGGKSFGYCFKASVASSLPQPIFALPALFLGATLLPFQPFGLGFAAGAMLYLAVVEMIPEAVALGGRSQTVGGVVLGMGGMYTLNELLNSMAL